MWEAPLPVRLRTLFFHRPPDDMAVLMDVLGSGPTELPFARDRKNDHKPHTWSFSASHVRLRLPAEDGPPAGVSMRYTRGVDRENGLTVGATDMSPAQMVFRSLQVGPTTRRGLFLPGGTRVRIPVQIPAGARLEFLPQLLPPEAADPLEHSDGVDLQVSIEVDGQPRLTHRTSLALGDAVPVALDLSALAGTSAVIEFLSEPGATPDLDHVFVAEPRVSQRIDDPPRVVVLLVDTLRADELSLYGYHRPTTPNLDAWSAEAAVFTQARSVAPWTLPSVRALLTGQDPELWSQATTLAERFGSAGWATGFIAGNVYLSSNFDMADGWGTHHCVNWPDAADQVDLARVWLDEHSHEPAFLVLHFMDTHLPYTEPESWRDRFAGPRPSRFDQDEFHRNDVVSGAPLTADEQAYVRARYDNNLAWVDHQVARVLEVLGDNDVVVLVSDHGEEFWDHGEFEHGHSLYDELIRVPLVVRAPGLPPGRTDVPVSLVDLAPTLLHAAGLPVDGLAGVDLATVLQAPQPDRALGFGRPLYGDRRWGAVQGALKYSTHRGQERVWDLATDPLERRPDRSLAQIEDGRGLLSTALGRPVAVGFRVRPSRGRASDGLSLIATVPGGFSLGLAGDDPTLQSAATVELQGDEARLTWLPGYRGTREVFLVPREPVAIAAGGLVVRSAADPTEVLRATAPPPPLDGKGRVLASGKIAGRSVKVTHAVVPIPSAEEAGTSGYDPEVEAELKALGYIH